MWHHRPEGGLQVIRLTALTAGLSPHQVDHSLGLGHGAQV